MTDTTSQTPQETKQNVFLKFFSNWKAIVGVAIAVVIIIIVAIVASYFICSKEIPPTQAISNPEQTKEISAQQALVNTLNSVMYDMKHGKKIKRKK